jgi:Amt family ammonium transporter
MNETIITANEALTNAKVAMIAANEAKFIAHNLWLLVATVLVFVMHLGFSMLEAGFVQNKNVVNILFKNVMIISLGLLTYYFVGFNLMYPGSNAGGFFAFSGFGLVPPADGMTADYANYTYWTDFIFQGMFAATCCTIVSGAVAERVKLIPFLIFCLLFLMISYPITGFWKWGAGWLDARGFYDFAGSTLVHSVGGWAALAGIILLGPRQGKFVKNTIKPIPGHSMPLATLGVFLLWFGWFGFNGGSVLSADPESVSLVFVTTALAAAAGAFGSFMMSLMMFRSYDLSMVLNGILGGLVGITASADSVSPFDAMIIGFIAGLLIPVSISFFDKLKLDDPVGATSVHLVCGIWGTLAVSLFGTFDDGVGEFTDQLLGISAIGLFTFLFAFMVFFILKHTMGIRVSAEEERAGLDTYEHHLSAYNY